MIISASRRTDIPAFFVDWFFNRIKEEYLFVANPMNPQQISRINLSPEVVDCIVFWSKNPYKMIDRLNELSRYNYYFQFTITGYGQQLEPNVPAYHDAINIFSLLSESIGKDKVIWRYDPIIFTENFDIKYHANIFEIIAGHLYGKTRRCVISFMDMYKKTARNMASVKPYDITTEQVTDLSVKLSEIALKYDLELTSCAEKIDLLPYGISHGKCIDDNLIEGIFGFSPDLKKDKTQRPECGCVESVDIGTYNTCSHGCLYCYANYSQNSVFKNYALHYPQSPLLLGIIDPDAKIHERKCASCKKIQTSFLK